MSGPHLKGIGSRRPADGLRLVHPPQEVRLDPMAGFASDAIVLRDLAGDRLLANQRAATLLGFASVEALASLPESLLVERFAVEDADGRPSDLPPFTGHEAFAGDPVPDRVLRFRDFATGWDRWVSVRARPLALGTRKILAVVHILDEVTERRRQANNVRFLADAGRRLSRSLARERILEHAAVMAVPRLGDECLIVERGGTSGFSPLAWHLPGAEPRERADLLLRAARPTLAVPPGQRRGVLVAPGNQAEGLVGEARGAAFRSILVVPIGGPGAASETLVLAMAADTGRVHHPTDLLLADEFANLLAAALGNARQLASEQHRLRSSEEREASAKRETGDRDRLLQILGQELHRPLERLVAASELLGRSGGGGGSERVLVELLQRQSLQLQAMVENLLETSALTSGQTPLQRRISSVRELLQRAVQGEDRSADRGLHDVWLEVPERLLVLGDLARLTRVFSTLLTTVRSYAPPGGGIRLRAASPDGAHVDVAVEDERARAAETPLDEVLELFAAGADHALRPAPGQALALSCIRRLVELHDGTVWARPPSPQGGVSFRVRLPLAFQHRPGRP